MIPIDIVRHILSFVLVCNCCDKVCFNKCMTCTAPMCVECMDICDVCKELTCCVNSRGMYRVLCDDCYYLV